MTRAIRQGEYKADQRELDKEFEPGISEWKLAFTTDLGRPPRFRGMPARDLGRLEGEVTAAQAWFGLKGTVAVRSSCEAGRDGFWLHRYLVAHGVDNPAAAPGTGDAEEGPEATDCAQQDARHIRALRAASCYGIVKIAEV